MVIIFTYTFHRRDDQTVVGQVQFAIQNRLQRYQGVLHPTAHESRPRPGCHVSLKQVHQGCKDQKSTQLYYCRFGKPLELFLNILQLFISLVAHSFFGDKTFCLSLLQATYEMNLHFLYAFFTYT